MKKVALVFVVAVLVPSLVLAWLAVRSLRDQQFLFERQQSLLDQHVTDAVAQNISDYLAQQQREFSVQVENLAVANDARTLATEFDDQLCRRWPLAEVGFCVTAEGKLLSPLPNARPAAQMFRLDNSGFLANREPVEVYLTANNVSANSTTAENASVGSTWNFARGQANQVAIARNGFFIGSTSQVPWPPGQPSKQEGPAFVAGAAAPSQAFALSDAGGSGGGGGGADAYSASRTASAPPLAFNGAAAGSISPINQTTQVSPDVIGGSTAPQTLDFNGNADSSGQSQRQSVLNYKTAQTRNVSPLSKAFQSADQPPAATGNDDSAKNLSKVIPAEAEFRQLIGDQTDGMLARFLQNKLKLMCWHRLNANPDLIFGAQLNLDRIVTDLRRLVAADKSLGAEICLAILDDNARPVVLSRAGFQANWKRPFVATEAGDALPHWEVAAYLVDPAQLTQAARTARLTLGLLVVVLVIAIGAGSLLIVRSLAAELKLARQKTDFVSNVSHELKTPLTSIRMFSELLAEGRVTDQARQHAYLQIITAEAARLTRLINNVLDFSRLESGEKKYNFQPCDLTEIVRTTAETFRPHLEAAGFKLECELPATPVSGHGDADALSQIIVNLLSNAEKYSNGGKEIRLQLEQKQLPVPYAEIRVLDRGPGVPPGSAEKIFEKFYRAHDSLSSGIQGSGLGLTIARQIARAHGGDVVYERRDGGGSCFALRLPATARL